MYHVIFLHACWSWESFLKKNKSILCLFLNFCRFCQTSKVNSTWCLIRSIIHRLKTRLVIFVCVISSILCKRRFHCISLKRLWLASVDIDTYCFDGTAINFWVQTELMQWATVCYRYCMSQTGTAVCVCIRMCLWMLQRWIDPLKPIRKQIRGDYIYTSLCAVVQHGVKFQICLTSLLDIILKARCLACSVWRKLAVFW